jgi:hypothetical protein
VRQYQRWADLRPATRHHGPMNQTQDRLTRLTWALAILASIVLSVAAGLRWS